MDDGIYIIEISMLAISVWSFATHVTKPFLCVPFPLTGHAHLYLYGFWSLRSLSQIVNLLITIFVRTNYYAEYEMLLIACNKTGSTESSG